MKIRHILAASGAIAAMAAASAASAQDWSGPYVGITVGGATVDDDKGEITQFDTNLDGTFGDTVNTTAPANAFSPGFCGGRYNGNNAGAGCQDDDDFEGDFGARAGYDWQMGNFVFGVVGEVTSVGVSDSTTAFSTTPAAYQFSREVDGALWAVRGRAGVPFGRTLAYATAGYAFGDIEETYQTTNTANSFTPTSRGTDADGYQVGLGAEHWLTDRFTIGAEYLYTSLDVNDPMVVRVGPGTAPPTNPFLLVNAAGTDTRRQSDEFNIHAFRLTLSARF